MADDLFTEKFRSQLPDSLHQYLVADENVIFRMPEASSDVGELVVWNDGDELTVGVGKISHHHFRTRDFDGVPPAEQMQRASAAAIEWIEAIFSNRVRFRVEYVGDRVCAGSWWFADQGDGGRWLKPTTRAVEYTWSGMQRTAERPAG
jgi:hypothetical protein